VVVIRNIQFIADEVYIGSGCGLVKESIEDREDSQVPRSEVLGAGGGGRN